MSDEHRLIDNTLVTEADGIVAKCTCGWISRPYFSGFTASIGFRDHQEKEARKQEEMQRHKETLNRVYGKNC